MKRLLLLWILVPGAGTLGAQHLDPVQWTLSSDVSKARPGATVPLKLTAKLEEGWHLYSPTTPPGGPNPTTIAVVDQQSKIFEPKPERKFDPNFGIDTETFEKEVVFRLETTIPKDSATGPLELIAQVRYQACNATMCLPPKKKTADYTVDIDPSAPAPPTFAIPDGYFEAVRPSESAPSPSSAPEPDRGFAAFLLTAFGLGLASIFTPCVFPMIPITVSFFLNQKGGIVQALVFSLGIIVLFCSLGFGVAAIVGPFGVVQLGANPWVNTFIAVVFGVFALSLLGAFEITLPSGLLTRLDAASRRGGYLGTLLMGLTFSLTSFACVGPFVGSILAASVQTKGVQPVLGMMSFATGLASPFFFLAAFPSYLSKLPRSGGWLARVKVVMGFILLAAMLKYLSVIDQVLGTNWLTRERFLAAWFVLFTLAGVYLLGLLRLEGIERDEPLGIGRLLVASAILIFAFSLLPGMFGSPLGALDAYVPSAPQSTTGPQWSKNDLPEALAKAKAENKLVLVTFTGYACTNCHWMKANMFPRPEIADAIKDMVLVELYTDGRDKQSEENQKLEDEKLKSVAIPYYAIFNGDGQLLADFAGSTSDAAKFLGFLKKPQSST